MVLAPVLTASTGGYVSFPDFEIFQRSYDGANAHAQGAESGHYERRIPTL